MMRVARLLVRHRTVSWLGALLLSALFGWFVADLVRLREESAFRAAMETSADREALVLRGITEDSKAMGAVRLAGQVNPTLKIASRVTDVDRARVTRPAADVLGVLTDQIGAELSFLVNRNGFIVGEWNRGVQATPIGQDVNRREYFRQAMQGRSNVFMALSLTASRRSLYLSAPVYQGFGIGGPIVGVVSARIYGETLDRFLGAQPGMTGLLISPHGVVMASSEGGWILTLVGAPTAERSRQLGADRQYGRQFDDYARTPVLPFDPAATTAKIRGERYAVTSRRVDWGDPGGPWRLVYVSDLRGALPLEARAGIGAAAALSLFALLAALLRNLGHRVTRRALEARLEAQGQRFAEIIERAPAGIGVVSDGTVQVANPALRELVDAEVGRPWPDAYADEASRARAEALLTERATGRDVELQLITPDGRQRTCLASFLPVTFQAPGTLLWLTDLTDPMAAEAEIHRAREAAESATRLRGDFLANMSHELRTPMNAIIGMSDLALQTDLDDRQRNYVEKAHRAAEHLLGIIDDILDFSRIEAGRLTLERIPFELDAVFDHVVQVLGLRLEQHGTELLLNVPAEVPTALVGDPMRLGLVLSHLGKHAARVSSQGEVVIAVSVVSTVDGEHEDPIDSGQLTLQFSLRDSGPGLSPSQLTRMLRQLDEGDGGLPDGGGLALTVCRQLVDLMGGRLWVESMPGAGTTFHFTVRLDLDRRPAEGRGADDRADRAPSHAGARVLVVDDSRIARDLLAALCRGQGLVPDTAASGEQALHMAQAAMREQRPYDWALVDWLMPGQDGLSVALELRDGVTPAPRVVIVTAFGNDDSLYEAMADLPPAQRPPVLAKPVTAATLRAVLDMAGPAESHAVGLARRDASARASTQAAMRAVVGARVLVVEDNAVNQELAEELLTQAGVTVTLAGNGAVALELLQASPDAFDGVLMDCQMPEMDGFEATRRLREDPRWRELPILALTASATSADRARILATGMNDHVPKPLHADELFEALARWVRPRTGVAPDSPATADRREAPAPARPEAAPWPTIDGLAPHAGLAAAGNNAALYARLLRVFFHSQQTTGERLAQAAATGDAEALGRLAHSLRGSAGTIGARALSDAAAALEDFCIGPGAGSGSGSASQCRDLTVAVEEALAHLLRALEPVVAVDGPAAAAAPGALAFPAPSTSDPGIALLDQRLARLHRQLAEHDAAAAEAAEALREELNRTRHGIPEPRLSRLREAMEAAMRFDFDAARQGLDEEVSRQAVASQDNHSPSRPLQEPQT